MTSEQIEDEDPHEVPRELHLPRWFVGRVTPAGYTLLGAVLALLLVGLAKWCLR